MDAPQTAAKPVLPKRWGMYVVAAGIAFLVLGMALTIGPAADARETRILEDRGISTTAVITGGTVTTHRGADTVKLEIEFDSDLGFPEEATVLFCGDLEDVSRGDDIEIVYDPDDPQIIHFTQCTYTTNATGFMIAGIAALVIGTFMLLRSWRKVGWKRRRWGIALAVIGLIFAAASFSENCECKEFIYTSSALVVIGVVPQFMPQPDQEPTEGVAGIG